MDSIRISTYIFHMATEPRIPHIRRVLTARLTQIKRSKLWLSRRQKAVSPGRARAWLYSQGKEDRIPFRTAEELFRSVGLRLTLMPMSSFDPGPAPKAGRPKSSLAQDGHLLPEDDGDVETPCDDPPPDE